MQIQQLNQELGEGNTQYSHRLHTKFSIDTQPDVKLKRLKFVTYNVWFETDFIDTR